MNDRFSDHSARAGSGSSMPPGDSPNDERNADELIGLAASRLDTDCDPVAEQDEHLLQWQAAEERRRREQNDHDGSHRDRMKRLARRIEAAVVSDRLPLIRRSGAPPLHAGAQCTSAAELLAGRDRIAPRIDLGVAAGIGRDLWDEPCDSWIQLPDELPAGRYIGLNVSGDSMEPLMHTGDVILVRVGPEVQSNTVIVARHPDDGYMVKRVDRLTSTKVVLGSLNAGYAQLAIPRDPSLIVGTVVLRWCSHDKAGHSSG